MNYVIHLLIYFEIYAIVALSLNLVVGYCGMLTLAHAAYFAIGGYVYALLVITLGFSFFQALLVAVLVAGVLSLAVSLPAWRLRGDFFVLASMAVQVLVFTGIYNWFDPNFPIGTFRNLTNGSFGISGIPKAEIMGWQLSSPQRFFCLATVALLLCGFIVWRLQSSPWGRLLVSMRDDELAARGLGKNTRLLKVQAIAISSGLVAISGALYAAYVGYLDPTVASLNESILVLSMVLVGGVGNFRGPLVGALVLILFPEVLRFMNFPDVQAANLRLAVYGLMLVLLMHFRPQGISGNYRLTLMR